MVIMAGRSPDISNAANLGKKSQYQRRKQNYYQDVKISKYKGHKKV